MAAVDNSIRATTRRLRRTQSTRFAGAILDSIRGLDGIPSHKRKRVKQVQQAIAKAERNLKRTPDEDEIATELGISLAEYQQWMLELRGVSLGSLDVIEDGEEVGLLKFIADDEAESPARIFERSELENLVTRGIKKMPENERLVLSLYYKEELNLREIASIMCLHVTRISQLRAQGILRLRALIEHKWPTGRGIF